MVHGGDERALAKLLLFAWLAKSSVSRNEEIIYHPIGIVAH